MAASLASCTPCCSYNELKRLATSKEGVGVPVNMHIERGVTGLDPRLGMLTLDDDETVHADLIIGADGIYVCFSRTTKEHQLNTSTLVNDEKVYQRHATLPLRKSSLQISHPPQSSRRRSPHSPSD